MATRSFTRVALAAAFACCAAAAAEGQTFAEWPLGLDSAGQEYQRDADAADHPDGGWTAVWLDYRLGHPALYARSFDAGDVPLGPGAPLTDGLGLFSVDLNAYPIGSPRVAATGDGSVLAVWRETRYGIDRIQAAIVRGNRLESEILTVNDADRPDTRSEPRVSVSGDRALVTWREGIGSFSAVHAQILGLGLQRIGANFRIDPETAGGQGGARIASLPDGWALAWRAAIAGAGDRVFLRRVDREGGLPGDPVAVDEQAEWNQAEPALTALADRLFVAWIASRVGGVALTARSFDQSLAPIAPPFLVVEEGVTVTPRAPEAVVVGEGSVLVAWTAGPASRLRFHAREVALPDEPIGAPVLVEDPEPPPGGILVPRGLSAVGRGSSGARLLWWDSRDGWDLLYRLNVDRSGVALEPPAAVEIDEGSASQVLPSAALFADGAGLVSWCDFRTGGLTIYGARLGPTGEPDGASFRISEETGGAVSAPATNLRDILRNQPSVVALSDGRSAAAWTRIFPNGESRVLIQIYERDGSRLGNNIELPLASPGARAQSGPRLASLPDSSFLIVWRDGGRDAKGDIIARRYLSDGTAGDTVHVADLRYEGSAQEKPAIASSGAGEAVVAWLDDRQGNFDVYIQRLGPAGRKIQRNTMVNAAEDSPIPQSNPAVAATFDRYAAVWDDNPLGNSAIRGLVVLLPTAKRAVEEVIPFQIAPLPSGFKYPAISMAPDGRFVVVYWDTSIDSTRVMAQRFNRDGTFFGPRYSVTSLWGRTAAIPGDVFAGADSILYAWADNREAKGWDVRVRKVSWEYGDVYTAVAIAGWSVEPRDGGLEVRWSVPAARAGTRFRLWRQIGGDPAFAAEPGRDARPLGEDWLGPSFPAGADYVYRDATAPAGRAVHYWIEDQAGEYAGPWSGRLDPARIPLALRALDNPFRDAARLSWSAPPGGEPILELFDVRGRSLRRERLAPPEGAGGDWIWDGTDRHGRPVPAGVYWIELRAGAARAEPVKLLRLR